MLDVGGHIPAFLSDVGCHIELDLTAFLFDAWNWDFRNKRPGRLNILERVQCHCYAFFFLVKFSCRLCSVLLLLNLDINGFVWPIFLRQILALALFIRLWSVLVFIFLNDL